MFKRLFHNSRVCYFDPHSVLGLQRNAGADEIKRAYRKLAKKYHPDLGSTNKEKFQEIQRAYDILTGKEKPEQPSGGQGFNGAGGFNPFGGSAGFNPFSGFSSFNSNPFSEFMNQNNSQPTELEIRLSVPFLDAVLGSNHQIKAKIPTNCKPCKSTGRIRQDTCTTCKGKGAVERVLQGMHIKMSCPQCGGSGYGAVNCVSCHGQGYTLEPKTLRFKVPPRTKTGDTIRIYHEDKTIYVQITVAPHPTFKQTSSGIAQCVVKVPILDAILGGSIKAPTLQNTKTITIKPGTNYNDSMVDSNVQYIFQFDTKLSESDRNKIRDAFSTLKRPQSTASTSETNTNDKPCSETILGKMKNTINKMIHNDKVKT